MPTKKDETTPVAAPAAPSTAKTSSPATKGKSHKTLFIILGIVIFLFVVLPLLASMFFFGALGTYFFHNVKVTGNGQTLTVGSGNNQVNVSTNQKWPDSMPSFMPKFTAGTIQSTTKIGNAWTVTASKVTEADYNNYLTSLRNAGVVLEDSVNVGTLMSDTGTKDNYRVSVTYTGSTDGNSILIGVTTENN